METEAARRTGAPVVQGFGLTETSPVTHAMPPDDPRQGSIGVPVPNTEVRLVSVEGQDLGPGETGEIWIRVPETILIEWRGRLGQGLTAKDIMLALCGRLGMNGGRYQAVQYTGEAISALDMQERMTLSNMAAELGGQTMSRLIADWWP